MRYYCTNSGKPINECTCMYCTETYIQDFIKRNGREIKGELAAVPIRRLTDDYLFEYWENQQN